MAIVYCLLLLLCGFGNDSRMSLGFGCDVTIIHDSRFTVVISNLNEE